MGNKSEKRRKGRAPFTYIKIILLRFPLYNILFDKKMCQVVLKSISKQARSSSNMGEVAKSRFKTPNPNIRRWPLDFLNERDSKLCYPEEIYITRLLLMGQF